MSHGFATMVATLILACTAFVLSLRADDEYRRGFARGMALSAAFLAVLGLLGMLG